MTEFNLCFFLTSSPFFSVSLKKNVPLFLLQAAVEISKCPKLSLIFYFLFTEILDAR